MSDPFQTYERIKVERKEIATITESNIHEIAKMIKAQVDYSGDEPVIVTLLEDGRPMKWKIGWHVSLLGKGLVNQNGFNRNLDWNEIDPAAAHERTDQK